MSTTAATGNTPEPPDDDPGDRGDTGPATGETERHSSEGSYARPLRKAAARTAVRVGEVIACAIVAWSLDKLFDLF